MTRQVGDCSVLVVYILIRVCTDELVQIVSSLMVELSAQSDIHSFIWSAFISSLTALPGPRDSLPEELLSSVRRCVTLLVQTDESLVRNVLTDGVKSSRDDINESTIISVSITKTE